MLAFVLEGFAKIYAHEKELKVLKSEIRKNLRRVASSCKVAMK